MSVEDLIMYMYIYLGSILESSSSHFFFSLTTSADLSSTASCSFSVYLDIRSIKVSITFMFLCLASPEALKHFLCVDNTITTVQDKLLILKMQQFFLLSLLCMHEYPQYNTNVIYTGTSYWRYTHISLQWYSAYIESGLTAAGMRTWAVGKFAAVSGGCQRTMVGHPPFHSRQTPSAGSSP